MFSMDQLVTFDVDQHQVCFCIPAAVRHTLFMMDVDALLVKQVVAADWASPLLSFGYPIQLRVSEVVRRAVFCSACRPVGVQSWVVGRGPTSHLHVTGNLRCGDTEQVVVSP